MLKSSNFNSERIKTLSEFIFSSIKKMYNRRKHITELSYLSDRDLRDIGISRSELEYKIRTGK
jgi:uncharacterized protein YjiS (DUF1127 family)